MKLSAVALLAVSSLVGADVDNEGHKGGGGAKAWVKDFDNLVAFGDSYTDENRLGWFGSHNGTAPPPGTILPESTSTPGGGITWPRWVSNYTGATLYNYAVSGAVCDNNMIYRYLASIFGPFPDVVYEAEAFVADTKFVNATTHKGIFPNRRADNTVYSMWIGTNDLGVGAFLTDGSLHETTIVDYLDCVYDRFDTIYKAGGRYFVFMNTAPLQLSPLYGMPGLPGTLTASHYFSDKNNYNITEISSKMKEYTKLVNNLYATRTPYELLIKNRYPGASIAVFDTDSLITDVYNNPTKYLASPANVTGQYYHCDLTGANCVENSGSLDQYLWYDELHPSQKTDEIVAAEFVKVVKGTSMYATYW